MALRVITAGDFSTVQDLGRFGYERFGVPQSGAMDPFALQAANRLVGNSPNAAGLEFVLEPPVCEAMADLLIAATGWGYTLHVQGRRVGAWRAAVARRGEKIAFATEAAHGWGYLAVLGGIDAPLVMGSRSTYLRGGFGGWQGRALLAQDVLPIGAVHISGWRELAGRYLPLAHRPPYAADVQVPVVLGPQSDAFTGAALEVFLSETYAVSPSSDRMGYRLSGPRLAHSAGADLISEPLAWGAVQVPADGQPLVLLSDRPTTGGYAKIATITRAGLPLLVQAMPGIGRVRFVAVRLNTAQAQYRALQAHLDTGIEEEQDDSGFARS